MQQQTNEEAPEALTHRSAATLALLAVFTIGAFLVSLIGPTAAGAQTAPAGDEVPTTSTTAAPAPSTTVPAPPTTGVPATTPSTTAPSTTIPAPSTLTAPPALTQPQAEAAGTRGPRSLAEATYVYSPREVKLAWNNSHRDKITLVVATRLAAYLNAVVEAQIRQYLLAVYLNAVANSVPNQANWDRVAACESGGNWSTNTGNGFYGGLQFSLSTWRSVGGTGLPSQNSRIEQIRRANILKDRAGLGQWPHCGRHFYG